MPIKLGNFVAYDFIARQWLLSPPLSPNKPLPQI